MVNVWCPRMSASWRWREGLHGRSVRAVWVLAGFCGGDGIRLQARSGVMLPVSETWW